MRKPNEIGHFFIILILIMLSSAICLSTGCMCTRKEKVAPIVPPGKTDAETFFICTENSHPYNPRIDGDFVVWQDERNGNMDIYGFDLSTKSEFPICTNESKQEDVAISGNIIIWVDHRKRSSEYDIYGYDLSNKSEFFITSIRKHTGPWRGPDIDENFIVWEDDREGYWEKYGYDISGYDIKTGRQFSICNNPSEQACPKVSGNITVWTDFRNGSGDIYGYNLSTKAEFPICTDEAYQGWADIYDNIVVWQDERSGNMDIYGYNLSTGTEFPICTELYEQNKPRVSGTTVVWEDERHSWWEEELNYWFYGYDLSKEKEFPIACYETIFGIQDFSDGIIVYYDIEEELYENIVGLILP